MSVWLSWLLGSVPAAALTARFVRVGSGSLGATPRAAEGGVRPGPAPGITAGGSRQGETPEGGER